MHLCMGRMEIFCPKAPAATLETLAEALKQVYAEINPKYGDTEVKVIGTRHGENFMRHLLLVKKWLRL